MTLTKLGIGVLGIALVATLTTLLVVQHQSLARLQEENQGLLRQSDQLSRVQADNERLSSALARVTNSAAISQSQILDLARLRAEVGRLRAQSNEVARLEQENRQIRAEAAAPIATLLQNQAKERRDQCIRNLALIQAAKTQWALDHNKKDTDRPRMVDLDPYFESTGGFPECPDHGIYILGAVGQNPRCNIVEHALP
jgi:hypothetical protein